MTLLAFLSTPAGRWTRAIAGIVLIVVGAMLGGWWFVLTALGVVFVLVGALDVCLLAPLFGKPLRGKDFRASQGV